MRALSITVAVIITLVVIAEAEDYTSTTPTSTFFGIDKNNDESMREKHRELADEQYKRMFGEDHPLPDFSGDLDGPPKEPSTFTQKIREAVKKFSDLFKRRPNPTSTPEPMD